MRMRMDLGALHLTDLIAAASSEWMLHSARPSLGTGSVPSLGTGSVPSLGTGSVPSELSVPRLGIGESRARPNAEPREL